MVQVKIQGNVYEQGRSRRDEDEIEAVSGNNEYKCMINVSKLQSTTVGIPTHVGAAPQVEKWK